MSIGYRLFLWLFTLCLSTSTLGRELTLPEGLKEWQDWVLYDHQDIKCPILFNQPSRHCTWVSKLDLQVLSSRATFRQYVTTYRKSWVTLPGNNQYWPVNVRLQTLPGKSQKHSPVRSTAGQPQLLLEPGSYQISGELSWSKMPQFIKIPPTSGLVSLKLNNKEISPVNIDTQQRLWLGITHKKEQETTSDSVNVRVYRLVKDSLPLELTTRLILEVSGSERELTMGPALLEQFSPLGLDSPLPARIEADGQLRIQVKPGRWQITLSARHKGPVNTISYDTLSSQWPQQEIWVFESQQHLRLAQVKGVESIDPSQTDLPQEWKHLPAFLMTSATDFMLEEQHRGDPTPSANRLELDQDIWLSFDGKDFTFKNSISGVMNKDWRLDTQPSYILGRAELNHEPQLITQRENGATGIEIRQSDINLLTVSHIPRTSELSATGWQTDFQRVSSRLHLPPGWSLLAAQGADKINSSWLSRWSLWDIFLVLIIAAAFTHLLGRSSGLLALLTLTVVYHRINAPVFIWLNLAAVLALMPVVSGRFKQWLGYYQSASFVILAIIIIPFSVDQIRQAIYPQLEHPWRTMKAEPFQRDTQQNRLSIEQDEAHSFEMEALESKEAAPVRARKKLSELADELAHSSTDSYARPRLQRQEKTYDPGKVVQTGPGIPQWRWNLIHLNWNGPVNATEKLNLYLIPPSINRVGNIISVCLILLMALRLLSSAYSGTGLPSGLGRWLKKPGSTSAALLTGLTLSLGMLPTPNAYSETASTQVVIDKDILKTLEQRLTEPAECLPDCASIESANLHISNNRLELTLVLNTQENLAIPLPVSQRDWQPQSVTLNGKATPLRYWRNHLYAAIPNGRHTIKVRGILTGINQLALPLPVPAHNVTASTPGWKLTGIRDGFSAHNIQLSRILETDTKKSKRLLPDPLPEFVRVRRTVRLGLEWEVETRVERITPKRGAIALSVPVLPGESLITEGLKIHDNAVQVNLSPSQFQQTWHSVLKKSDSLSFTASQQHDWTEIWSIESNPNWHIEYEGIAPVKPGSNVQNWIPQWRPWPGETVTIQIDEPQAVAGKHTSIDSVHLKYNVGQRSDKTDLRFSVRSSQGQMLPFTLPEGAQLQELLLNGVSQPITQETGDIKIPVQPGKQEIGLHWQTATGVALKTETPLISLPETSSNTRLSIRLPSDRWPVFVGGPAVGPAILYWGWVIVIALLAVVLGRTHMTPLKPHHWFLLSLGMSTANIFSPLVIVMWFFALAKRGKLEQLPSRIWFNWMQLGLFFLSTLAIITLLGTIPYGLLASPDMHILGNGSTAYSLHWYQDMSQKALPQAWVVSLPMWVYRVAMLAWSLWLAFAIMGWIRWSWTQIGARGLWLSTAPDKTPSPNSTESPDSSPSTTKE